MPDQAELTFGLELECVRPSTTVSQVVSNWGLQRHMDRSILDRHGRVAPEGLELITPVRTVQMTYTGDGRQMRLDFGNNDSMIREMATAVGEINASCGIHLHLGKPSKKDPRASLWEPERVRTMLIICKMLEPRLWDLVPASRRNNQHCLPIDSRYTADDFEQFYPVGDVRTRKYDNPKRYCWMNMIETRRVGQRGVPGYGDSPATGTVENRLLGETAEAEYVINWTKLWLTIAGYVAFVPSSLAIMHCTMGRSLSSLIQAVENSKRTFDESRAPRPATPRPAPATPTQRRPARTPSTVVAEAVLPRVDQPNPPSSPIPVAPRPARRRTVRTPAVVTPDNPLGADGPPPQSSRHLYPPDEAPEVASQPAVPVEEQVPPPASEAWIQRVEARAARANFNIHGTQSGRYTITGTTTASSMPRPAVQSTSSITSANSSNHEWINLASESGIIASEPPSTGQA